MLRRFVTTVAALALGASALLNVPDARAGFTSGSDGSDGVLNCAWLAKNGTFNCGTSCTTNNPYDPACVFIIDLGKAKTASWDSAGGDVDGDGFGDGVYDTTKWAVVYKFSSISIPANVKIVFKNHPSGAPVVFLSQGNVDVFGEINLDGESAKIVQSWPYFTEPGPGGFPGGSPADRNSRVGSIGYGPGSDRAVDVNEQVVDGCYSGRQQYFISNINPPDYGTCDGAGRVYGNNEIVPLIGGSGGGVAFNAAREFGVEAKAVRWVTGGAGGGAILIASDLEIQLGPHSNISAIGGDGYCTGNADLTAEFAGSGTAGSIRLVAGVRVYGAAGLATWGRGWPAPDYGCRDGGAFGRLRIEAPLIGFPPPDLPQAGISFALVPGAVFPGDSAPRLEVVSISENGVPVTASADPDTRPDTPDMEIDTDQQSQVVIRAWNIAAGTTVTVRVIPMLGNEILATSTGLQAQPDGSLRATANVVFPAGRSEVQLRANW